MTTLTVYDPPMCCATGICGTDVDQGLVELAADLDWLKSQGVNVRRINLSQEPAEFASNATIKELMRESEGDDLPAFLLDGRLVAKARYPSRAELAGWAGAGAPNLEISDQVRELIALGAAIAASCEPCLKYHTNKARAIGLTDEQMREAIAVGRMVKEASAGNMHALAEKLVPEAAKASACCGSSREKTAEPGSCCGGAAKSATDKEKAGSCC